MTYFNYWKPFKDLLNSYGDIKKVYFSADGVFNKINLAGLWDPESGNYVIDEYDIHLMSNTKDMLFMEREIPRMISATLVGYPDFENQEKTDAGLDDADLISYQPLPASESRYFSRGAVS